MLRHDHDNRRYSVERAGWPAGHVPTAVVTDDPNGKEYRNPTAEELEASSATIAGIRVTVFEDIPSDCHQNRSPSGSRKERGRVHGVPVRIRPSGRTCSHRDNCSRLGRSSHDSHNCARWMRQRGYPDDWARRSLAFLRVRLIDLLTTTVTLCLGITVPKDQAHVCSVCVSDDVGLSRRQSCFAGAGAGYHECYDWIAQMSSDHPQYLPRHLRSSQSCQATAPATRLTGCDVLSPTHPTTMRSRIRI